MDLWNTLEELYSVVRAQEGCWSSPSKNPFISSISKYRPDQQRAVWQTMEQVSWRTLWLKTAREQEVVGVWDLQVIVICLVQDITITSLSWKIVRCFCMTSRGVQERTPGFWLNVQVKERASLSQSDLVSSRPWDAHTKTHDWSTNCHMVF